MKCEVEKFMVKRIQWLWYQFHYYCIIIDSMKGDVNKLRKAKIKIEDFYHKQYKFVNR